jgi:Holliday junction resolvasome RuvABC endonuclease subunit
MSNQPTILGIDPGTKRMGVAVLRGRELLAFGVHTLRNGERPHDVIGQARQLLLAYVRDFVPALVAIEKPLRIPSDRGAQVLVIAQELHARARELGIPVLELDPREVRRIVTGNSGATKIEVAEAIVGMGFEELRPKLPEKPKRAALGLRPRDKYWLHLFDALAVGIAVQPALHSGDDGAQTTLTRAPASSSATR